MTISYYFSEMSWGSSQVLKKSAAWLVWQSDRIPNNWGKIMTELERAKQQLQGEKRQMQVLLKWDGGQVFFKTGACCNCMQCQVRADSIPTTVYASCWYILKAQWRLMICLSCLLLNFWMTTSSRIHLFLLTNPECSMVLFIFWYLICRKNTTEGLYQQPFGILILARKLCRPTNKHFKWRLGRAPRGNEGWKNAFSDSAAWVVRRFEDLICFNKIDYYREKRSIRLRESSPKYPDTLNNRARLSQAHFKSMFPPCMVLKHINISNMICRKLAI